MSRLIRLQKWQIKDAKRLAALANNPRIASNMRDAFPHPYTIDRAHAFIDSTLNDPHFNHVHAIVFGHEIVGSIGLFQEQDIYRFNYEIGYWLGEAYWGKGIMSESVKGILAYAKAHTDAHRIYAGVFEPNLASAQVLLKNKFIQVGRSTQKVYKNGTFINESLFEIIL